MREGKHTPKILVSRSLLARCLKCYCGCRKGGAIVTGFVIHQDQSFCVSSSCHLSLRYEDWYVAGFATILVEREFLGHSSSQAEMDAIADST